MEKEFCSAHLMAVKRVNFFETGFIVVNYYTLSVRVAAGTRIWRKIDSSKRYNSLATIQYTIDCNKKRGNLILSYLDVLSSYIQNVLRRWDHLNGPSFVKMSSPAPPISLRKVVTCLILKNQVVNWNYQYTEQYASVDVIWSTVLIDTYFKLHNNCASQRIY